MKKLSELYITYFQLTEERYAIENDKANWPKFGIADYKAMVTRVNQIYFDVRRVAQKIEKIERNIC